MKLTKEKLKSLIKEELEGVQLDPETRLDRMDDLRSKFSPVIATALQKGLTADDVQKVFGQVLERVTVHGYDTRRP